MKGGYFKMNQESKTALKYIRKEDIKPPDEKKLLKFHIGEILEDLSMTFQDIKKCKTKEEIVKAIAMFYVFMGDRISYMRLDKNCVENKRKELLRTFPWTE